MVQPTRITVGSATFCGLLAQNHAVAKDGMMKAAVKISSGVIVSSWLRRATIWNNVQPACRKATHFAKWSALLRSQMLSRVISGILILFLVQR